VVEGEEKGEEVMEAVAVLVMMPILVGLGGLAGAIGSGILIALLLIPLAPIILMIDWWRRR
jgi:hypothetical protein